MTIYFWADIQLPIRLPRLCSVSFSLLLVVPQIELLTTANMYIFFPALDYSYFFTFVFPTKEHLHSTCFIFWCSWIIMLLLSMNWPCYVKRITLSEHYCIYTSQETRWFGFVLCKRFGFWLDLSQSYPFVFLCKYFGSIDNFDVIFCIGGNKASVCVCCSN